MIITKTSFQHQIFKIFTLCDTKVHTYVYFQFQGAGMILSLEHSVPERLKKAFTNMFVVTLTAITLLYLSFGWCGYLSFGPETHDLITMNLDPPENGGWDWAEFIRYCLALALTFTYPVMLFPVIKMLKPRLENFFGCSKVSNCSFKILYQILRLSVHP